MCVVCGHTILLCGVVGTLAVEWQLFTVYIHGYNSVLSDGAVQFEWDVCGLYWGLVLEKLKGACSDFQE